MFQGATIAPDRPFGKIQAGINPPEFFGEFFDREAMPATDQNFYFSQKSIQNNISFLRVHVIRIRGVRGGLGPLIFSREFAYLEAQVASCYFYRVNSTAV